MLNLLDANLLTWIYPASCEKWGWCQNPSSCTTQLHPFSTSQLLKRTSFGALSNVTGHGRSMKDLVVLELLALTNGYLVVCHDDCHDEFMWCVWWQYHGGGISWWVSIIIVVVVVISQRWLGQTWPGEGNMTRSWSSRQGLVIDDWLLR